jgi:galactosamine-6-phosphate isomerase
MVTKIFTDNDALSDYLAEQMIELILEKPTALICFASGNSPRNTAACFVQKVQERKVDLSRFHFIGLDEWVGVPSAVKGSCQNDFRTWLFDPLGIKESQYHLFDGMAANLDEECIRMDEYISAQGGIDMMVVGIGMNGHIGFNEPGSSFDVKSHVVPLDEITSSVGQKYFEQSMKLSYGITLGFQHLLSTKKVFLIANGEAKAGVIQKAVEGEVTPAFPASVMQMHEHGFVLVDEAAASLLKP